MSAVRITQHEAFIEDRKYLHKSGVLYMIRDRESDDDYQVDEKWTHANWCGEKATYEKHITMFVTALAEKKAERTKAMAKRLLGALSAKPTGLMDSALNLVTTQHVTFKDRYEDAILAAFNELGNTRIEFCELYPIVAAKLGADAESAKKGVCPDPYTGKQKDIRGLLRSWVEERSPHSRQHYFRGGSRQRWLDGERPLYFVNYGLERANRATDWMPYVRVRGDGWTYDPDAAAMYEKPTEATLEKAAAAYRKKGMRGKHLEASQATDVATFHREVHVGRALAGAAMAVNALNMFGYFAAN